MSSYLDQLKPQERRWLVFFGVIIFLVLNYVFVWPHFHDLAQYGARMARAERTNELYRTEARHKEEYTRKLIDLQADGSGSVLPEDQAVDFVRFYSSRAVSNKVVVVNQGPLVTRTNEFFLEQQMGITVQADETNLVNFLYSLGAGNSMMRVRAMSLHPDPGHMQLNASVTLVASYQKKVAPRSPATPAGTPKAPAVTAPKPPPAQAAVSTPPPAAIPIPAHTNKLAGALARPTATNKLGTSISKTP